MGGICAASSCTDGIKNGNETGVDCGGSCAPCTVGQVCGGGTPSLTACAASLKCSCGSCYTFRSGPVTIESCSSTGAASGGYQVGGLRGESLGALTLSNSYSSGSVIADAAPAGGFVGLGGGSLGEPGMTQTMTNFYPAAPIVSVAGAANPGFTGGAAGSVAISYPNCFFDQPGGTAVTGYPGISGVTMMNSAASFPGFDFTSIWKLPPGAVSPQLIWQP